jgi:hypothetical protein
MIRAYSSVAHFAYDVVARLMHGQSPLPPRYASQRDRMTEGGQVPGGPTAGVDASMLRDIAVPVGSLVYKLAMKYGSVDKIDEILHKYLPHEAEQEIKRGAHEL